MTFIVYKTNSGYDFWSVNCPFEDSDLQNADKAPYSKHISGKDFVVGVCCWMVVLWCHIYFGRFGERGWWGWWNWKSVLLCVGRVRLAWLAGDESINCCTCRASFRLNFCRNDLTLNFSSLAKDRQGIVSYQFCWIYNFETCKMFNMFDNCSVQRLDDIGWNFFYFYYFYGCCPLLGQLFLIFTMYYMWPFVRCCAAVVTAAAAAGCRLFCSCLLRLLPENLLP